MAVTLTYYYTNGASYFSDAALTAPTTSPSAVYADFANDGKLSTGTAPVSWAVLSNGIYDVGFIIDPPNSGKAAEPSSGAAIGYISYRGGSNLISAHDGGRLLQPSWWAKPLNADPSFVRNQGAWNPATGVGRVDGITFSGGVAEFAITPYLFSAATLEASATTASAVQRVSFDATGELILLWYDFTYTGAQRIGFWANAPALYSPESEVANFVSYRGAAPWTGDTLTSVNVLAVGHDREIDATENWGALVNGSNYGIGMLALEGTMYVNSWETGGGWGSDIAMDPNMGPAPGLTTASQIKSGTVTEEGMALAVLNPGTYSFGAVVTVGSVTDIRSRFDAYLGEDRSAGSTASLSIDGPAGSTATAAVTIQRAVQIAVWAEDGGQASSEVTREYLIALDSLLAATASISIRGALTDSATGSVSVKGSEATTATGSVSVSQARTTSATGSASVEEAISASATASSVLAVSGYTATADASASVLDALSLAAPASTSVAARTTTSSTTSLAWEAPTSTSTTGSVYIDTAGPEVTTAATASASITDTIANAATASVVVNLAGERSASPSVSIFGEAATGADAGVTISADLDVSATGSVVVGADVTDSATGSVEIAPACSATASVIIGSPFQPSKAALKLNQSPTLALHASPTIRLVEGIVRNGFKLEVPYATNYAQTVDFYQSDRTTPRDVSAYDVALVVEADGAAAGFTVTATNGTETHQKILTFTAAQLVRMKRAARITINAGGESGPEDAARGTFIAA